MRIDHYQVRNGDGENFGFGDSADARCGKQKMIAPAGVDMSGMPSAMLTM